VYVSVVSVTLDGKSVPFCR